MTDITPETAAVRKVRVSPSQPPPGNLEYWQTHIQVVDCDDDPTFEECEDDLDAWIQKMQRCERAELRW